jgi:hypothetical protein
MRVGFLGMRGGSEHIIYWAEILIVYHISASGMENIQI